MVHLLNNSDHVTYYNKLQVDFKLTGNPSKPTPNGTETREWTHRLLKKYTFLQPRNVNAKTWHTGVWNFTQPHQAPAHIFFLGHVMHCSVSDTLYLDEIGNNTIV